MNGATAVVCESCFAASGENPSEAAQRLKYACKGWPGKDGRVLMTELVGEFGHDMSKH